GGAVRSFPTRRSSDLLSRHVRSCAWWSAEVEDLFLCLLVLEFCHVGAGAGGISAVAALPVPDNGVHVGDAAFEGLLPRAAVAALDRKSAGLNSSHVKI